MATVNKDFRVKHGLVVEGSTATVNGSNVLTEASTEFLQDTVAGMVDGSHTNLTVSYNDTTGKLTFAAENGVADSTTTDLTEGTNLYFTDERAQDAAASLFTSGTHNGIEFSYNDNDGKIVATVTGAAVPTFTTGIIFEGSVADEFETTIQVTNPTADRTLTIPDVSGNIVTTGDTGSVTNTMLAGSIANEKLSNSTITINGTSTSLGGTRTLYTDDITEDGSPTNLWFTDERAQDAVGNAVGTGLTYNDTTGAISVTANTYEAYGAVSTHAGLTSTHGVTGNIVGTTDSQTLTNKTISGSNNTISNIGNSSLTNSSITINGSSISLGGSATFGTDNIGEGTTNLYFTNERAQDAIGNAVGNGLDYDDATGAISVDPSEFALNAVGAPTGNVSMATYKITSLGTPTDGTDAATKAYVDSVTEGLHIHESVVAATTTNVSLATDLENGDTLDGITLATGNRILVKNQTTQSENGIYVVQASGQPTRATDFDTATEVDSGDFVFVYSGTTNASTGWVQTNKPATIGTDAIVFTQFSGAGTYLAGNGLTLTGNSFSINTAITADLSTAQTLTNKSISGSANTLTNIPNNALSNSAITINGTSTSLGGSRTLGSDDIAEGSTNKYFTDERAQDAAAAMITAGTHTNITVSYDDNANTLSLTGAVTYTDENARDAIGAALVGGSGIGITVNDGADTITVANSGVLSITGTASQVVASASTGAVTLSLPQNIATNSSPTFSGLTVGSVTLTDALTGTATQSLTDSNATVIDAWSASAYRSGKYVVQMIKGSDIEVIEVLVAVDGNNNVYLTEYANVISNAQIGTTDADYSSGNVRLLVTASNGTTVKVHRTLIEA